MQTIHIIAFILFFVGYLCKKQNYLPTDFYKKINTFIIYFCLPSIALLKIPKLNFNGEMLHLVFSAWLVFFGGIPFFYLLSKLFKWDKATLVSLIVVCGLGNTAFLGMPIISAVFGEGALQYAIFVDQPGSFLIISTLATAICIVASSGKISIKQIFVKLFTFPPFLAFLAAIIFPIHPSGIIEQCMLLLIKIIGPLALLSLGLQFSPQLKEMNWLPFSFGLLYRLVLGPLLVFIYFKIFYGKSDIISTVGVLENAMSPMMTAAIITEKYNLNPKLGNSLVSLGVPVSFITFFIWKLLLEYCL